MTSFVKKGLFLSSVFLLSFGSFSLFAQSDPENIPCKQENSGFCVVAGKKGICSNSVCKLSSESQTTSGATYPAVGALASTVFNGFKNTLNGFKGPLEVAAATTTNPDAAKANQKALEAFNTNYDKLSGIFTQMEYAYSSEISMQEAKGAEAKDAHFLAATKANQKWAELYNRDITPILSSSMFPPQTRDSLRSFYLVIPGRMNEFVRSAKDIQNGTPINDASVQPTDNTAGDAARNQVAAGNKTLDEDGAGCSPFSFNLGKCMNAIFSWIARVVFVNIAFFVFYLSGVFLHFSIHFGLVSMKSLITEDVYTLWLFTRNLALAGCLFATLYFVGMYLVGLGQKIERQAVAVILFAIFSGFSFTLSTYLIDGSNLITTSLYSSIDQKWAEPSRFALPVISGKFSEQLGWQGFSSAIGAVNPDSILGKISQGGNPFSGVALNLLVAATLLYDAYVLFMMGILFLIRNIGLFAAVIFSPLLLIDKTIPKLSEWADKYRRFFFGLLALGPVFMFLMYIALKVTEVILTGTRKLSGQISGANEGLILFQVFTVTAIFYFTYKTCKTLSGALGDAALGAVSGLASKAMIATPLGAAGRVAAFAGQNTIGRLARRSVREGGTLSNMKEKGGFFGRTAFSAANYAGNTATYDFNNTKAFAGAKANLEKRAGVSIAVSKGLGYVDTREKIRKETVEKLGEMRTEEGRQIVLDKGARRFDRATSLLPSTNPNSERGGRLNDFKADLSQGTTKKAKSTIKDEVGAVNLDDFTNKSDDSQKSLIKKLGDIYKKSEGSNDEIKKYAKETFENKVLVMLSDAVKSSKDSTLDPLSPNFEINAKAEFTKIARLFDDSGKLPAGVTVASNTELLEKFKLQMGMYATQRKKELGRSTEQNAPANTAPRSVAVPTSSVFPQTVGSIPNWESLLGASDLSGGLGGTAIPATTSATNSPTKPSGGSGQAASNTQSATQPVSTANSTPSPKQPEPNKESEKEEQTA